ncbi:PAS domain S-box protein [Massilia sp. PAMC28688]|uniref:PAS domain S-box protein n=1 Tax=Massilia sp. PAMC28688 TaxID=2861283 RepID=UPI001C630A74|nr:PAS domain S-box protein [Massilia sp. PAMC28688]QYF93537.1 PAS domain S-box protein [Massilia sp. PAMC28688]
MPTPHELEKRPWSEAERLAVLASYQILDTTPEQSYDDVVTLVSQLFDAPIVAVNLIADGRQWFKSEKGLGVREMPLDDSICKIAILEQSELVIPDTLQDPRLACNALVTGGPGLRFYAGVLLKTPEGVPLGTLCVLDTVARPQGATPSQMFALRTLAGQVMSQLTLHKTIHEQQKLLAVQEVTERELFDSRERFQQIVRQAATGVVQTDVDGRFILVNKKYCDMLGYTEGELLGKTVMEVTAEDSRDATQASVALAAAGGNGFVIEKRYRRKDGSLIWAKSNVNSVRDGNGVYQGLVAIVVDISDSKLAEARLSEADRRKTEFLATLAHELRNPLAPIRSGLGVMRLGADNPAVVAKVRDMMDRQVTHMVRLIDDLLDVARISGGKLELKKSVVDLKAVLFSAVETSLPLIEGGQHALSLEVSDEELMVDVDATRVAQVVSNLLNNSAKYTPAQGRIVLKAWREGQEAVVSVTDNGVGIPAEALVTVFEMFSQVGRNLERAQGGLGIGLSLVRRLVDMHGGSVAAHSAGPGQGCTFTVRLPLFSVGPASLPALPERSVPGAVAPLRILLADDNVDAADTLATMMELTGHTISVAHDGLAAVARAAEFAPDVVFLDIGMPGLNGYDAARRIRATAGLEHVILLALTGWGAQNDHALADAAGFDYHLTKPVQFDLVSSLLARLAEERPQRDGSLTVVR